MVEKQLYPASSLRPAGARLTMYGADGSRDVVAVG